MAEFLKAMGIGLLVTLAACMFSPDLAMFTLASIVCTAGIGLVIWIPVWFLIGAGSLAVIRAISGQSSRKRKSKDARSLHPAATKPKSGDARSLEMVADYIRRETVRQTSPIFIDQRLKEAGWSDAIIARAHRIAESE